MLGSFCHHFNITLRFIFDILIFHIFIVSILAYFHSLPGNGCTTTARMANARHRMASSHAAIGWILSAANFTLPWPWQQRRRWPRRRCCVEVLYRVISARNWKQMMPIVMGRHPFHLALHMWVFFVALIHLKRGCIRDFASIWLFVYIYIYIYIYI